MQQPVAFVTGSTRGIGRAVARRLAQEGYAIALNYYRNTRVAETALAEIQALTVATLIQADVTDPAAVAAAIDTVLRQWGRLDLLVNNVGPFLFKSAAETAIPEWRAMVEGNLNSAFYCIHYALPHLRAVAGQIINLGTLNVETGRSAPRTTAYTAAKSGLMILTKSLARTEGPYGVRVNLVNPGVIDTSTLTEAEKAHIIAQVPLGRLGTPADVAEAIAFLASERASYITGAVLNVAGGLWV